MDSSSEVWDGKATWADGARSRSVYVDVPCNDCGYSAPLLVVVTTLVICAMSTGDIDVNSRS
ncbi:hypothetical protein BDW22DRAFT_1361458 [Trametopsis cervina]|nr:hypothetical protein BDW22DRAFT_1361458 [Trametopsis cervina]